MRAICIISRGLYIFYPISKDYFFVFKKSKQVLVNLPASIALKE